MRKTLRGRLYDYPQYYDLIFGPGSRIEFDFLGSCFKRYARRPVRRVFEPACGTGRLLIRFAEGGFEVSGNDLNRRAVEYCNARFARKGFPAAAVLGDMANFRLSRKVDAAFNTINSFRHLLSEELAESHLESAASNLARGGLYILGLHLIPTRGKRMVREKSSAGRGRLTVASHMWSKRLNLRKREEVCGMTSDICTPRRSLRIVEELVFRTYTARQMQFLLSKIPQFEMVATYDFGYSDPCPISIGPETEDVAYVLRKR